MLTPLFEGYATSSTEPGTTTDPSLSKALDLIESGTRELEEGDIEGAKRIYEQSLKEHETSGGWFNLGVGAPCGHFHGLESASLHNEPVSLM